jgi:alcohol dehydrogenase
MAIASSIGGWMLGHSHCNAGHSIAHIIGALFDVPHGNGVAASNPYVLEFNAPVMPERVKHIAELLGAKFSGKESPEEIGAKARDAFIEFRDVKCKLKPVKAFGYDESKFDEAAQMIVDELFQLFQPRKMTVADAKAILKKIYAE